MTVRVVSDVDGTSADLDEQRSLQAVLERISHDYFHRPRSAHRGRSRGDEQVVSALHPGRRQRLKTVSQRVDASDDGDREVPESADRLIVGGVEVEGHLRCGEGNGEG